MELSEPMACDHAISAGRQHGYTIALDALLPPEEGGYRDTPLPFSENAVSPPQEKPPERIREMRRLYEYGRESAESKAENFYRQAVFMEDYEDDVPWTGEFIRYFPTYHDLTTKQLRGYFTWRTHARRGKFLPIATSAVYIYLYELLNGIGVETPEEVLQKLLEFEAGYLDSGIGDGRIRTNLRRWMTEYAVLHNLPRETAYEVADAETITRNRALSVLKEPEAYTDEAVFEALCALGQKRMKDSPVITREPARGMRLFSEAWRSASGFRLRGKDLFTLCFGERVRRRWYPLSNAVYYERQAPEDRDYVLDDCTAFRCRDGIWESITYEKLSFDRDRFRGFLHEADMLLRRYLKTGRYLKENPADKWAVPCIEAVIREEERARLEAARPKITIDFSGLAQIRRDAAGTRDSLLTEDELGEAEVPVMETATGMAESFTGKTEPDADVLPITALQTQILRALLRGEDASEIIRENHLMPTVVADAMNEVLFDVIGDTVVLCEDDRLFLVDDYMEELERYAV